MVGFLEPAAYFGNRFHQAISRSQTRKMRTEIQFPGPILGHFQLSYPWTGFTVIGNLSIRLTGDNINQFVILTT